MRLIGARIATAIERTHYEEVAKSDPLAERPDMDFSKGTRGKYTNLLTPGTNVAIIEPALHEHFPDSEAVNAALRAVLVLREQLSLLSGPPASKRQAKAA